MLNQVKLGIDITFFDESPRRSDKHWRNLKEANTASEFGYAVVPGKKKISPNILLKALDFCNLSSLAANFMNRSFSKIFLPPTK